MQRIFILSLAFLELQLSLLSGAAQSILRGTPGAINHFDGSVFLNNKKLRSTGNPVAVTNRDTLQTADGRVEVILGPGNFLRLGGQSEIKFVSLDAFQTTVAIAKGEILLETLERDSHVSLAFPNAVIRDFDPGIYEVNAKACRVEVFQGAARMDLGSKGSTQLRKGQAAACTERDTSTFDVNRVDALTCGARTRQNTKQQQTTALLRHGIKRQSVTAGSGTRSSDAGPLYRNRVLLTVHSDGFSFPARTVFAAP